jgi:multidrug efflux pump subunit AcrB
MWIVRLALSRPYTFIVMAMVIILLTPVVLMRTPTDIFPNIDIPVISLVWNYTGLQPQEMEQRITSNSERAVTTLVNDVEHLESQSLNGIAVVKIYFQPKANRTGSDHCHRADNFAHLASRYNSSPGGHLLRFHGPRHSNWFDQ